MPIATKGSECVVFLVEGECVDCVALACLLGLVFGTVAFKAEVVLLVLVGFGDVVAVDGAAAFDRADHEALAIAEAADGGRRELEGRLNQVDGVEGLVLDVVLQVPNVDVAILVSGDEQGPLIGHVMDGHRNIRLADLLQLHQTLPDPELDAAVPAAADYKCVVCLRVHDAEHFFDWLRVRANRTDLVAAQVPFVDVVVSAGDQNSWLIELPAGSQDARRRFLHCHLTCLASWFLPDHALSQHQLLDRDCAVPVRDDHHLLEFRVALILLRVWREFDCRYCFRRGQGDRNVALVGDVLQVTVLVGKHDLILCLNAHLSAKHSC